MEGPRALRPEEFGSLVELLNLAFRHEDGDMGAEFTYFLNERNAPRLRVFVEGEKVVAHCGYRLHGASVFGAGLSVGCIGAVSTHPERRGGGLATKLFLDCIESMRAEGADFAMISGGRGLYTRNAAVTAGRATEFVFPAERAGEWDSDVEVAPAAPAEAARLAALYRSEAVRFLRPPGEWKDILAGRHCMNRPAGLFSIRRGGELVAYAATRRPNDEHDKGGSLLGELAGCRHSLAAALPELARQGNCPRLKVHVGAHDAALAAELTARGLEPETAPGIGGTVKLANAAQLIERLRPLLVERAGERAGRLKFERGGGKVVASLDAERLELTEENACRVVFGTRDGAERGLLAGRGELGKILAAAFPLEIPWYGYNYV